MRNTITTVMMITALAGMSVVGLAASPAQTPAQPAAKQQAKPAALASHTMTGVVKSVDATSLVITRSGKPGGEMRFVLNPSTLREGTVAVGTSVSLRYREEGKTHVATAITAETPKKQAAQKTPSGR
jgi:hypothetical protein